MSWQSYPAEWSTKNQETGEILRVLSNNRERSIAFEIAGAGLSVIFNAVYSIGNSKPLQSISWKVSNVRMALSTKDSFSEKNKKDKIFQNIANALTAYQYEHGNFPSHVNVVFSSDEIRISGAK
jgi:hypothetical protein